MNYSDRIASIHFSPIRKLTPFANKAKSKGVKVYPLNIGQPDIKTPQGFFDSIKEFNKDVLAYAPSEGILELIHSLQRYYTSYDMHFESSDILITNGGSEALLFSIMSICDPFDNILVPEPFYTNYTSFAQSINVDIIPITTKAEDGFHLPSKDIISSLITPKTKAILLSNPSNPTGTVYTKEELYMLAQLAKDHNLWIISDEVYREFIYDDINYISFGNIADVEDRVIIIDSVSKRYSACGARIGSIASKNKDIISQILKLCQGRLCVSTLDQIGAIELYNTPSSYFDKVNKEYKKRRDLLYNELIKIDGVICKKPSGAFYVVVKLPVKNSEDFAIWLLNDFEKDGETVMITPAKDFYITDGIGNDEIRLAYILNEHDLLKAVSILKEGLKKYIDLKN